MDAEEVSKILEMLKNVQVRVENCFAKMDQRPPMKLSTCECNLNVNSCMLMNS